MPPHADLPPVEDRKLVFLHIPKTGGTTLHHHFSRHFAPEEICPERFSNLAAIPPERMARYRYFSGHFNFDELHLIPGPRYVVTVLRDPIERILSTYYFWKRHKPEVVEAQGLQGPAVARAGDLAAFLGSNDPAVTDAIDNTMARYLAGRVNVAHDGGYRYVVANAGMQVTELQVMHRATAHLLALDYFGFTAHLNEVYGRVSLVFGMPQLSQLGRMNAREEITDALGPAEEEEVTPELMAKLRGLTMLDRELYRLARAHWRERSR